MLGIQEIPEIRTLSVRIVSLGVAHQGGCESAGAVGGAGVGGGPMQAFRIVSQPCPNGNQYLEKIQCIDKESVPACLGTCPKVPNARSGLKWRKVAEWSESGVHGTPPMSDLNICSVTLDVGQRGPFSGRVSNLTMYEKTCSFFAQGSAVLSSAVFNLGGAHHRARSAVHWVW